jgi:hypothetical protein
MKLSVQVIVHPDDDDDATASTWNPERALRTRSFSSVPVIR